LRTLVIGIPLPDVSFDNASFLSAPTLSEYTRVVVDTSAAATSVQDIVNGQSAATTFGGQAVVNGPGSAYSFPLSELLEMRRREAARLLDGGGLIVILGHPLSRIYGIVGADVWHNYRWLPEPDGFTWESDLAPGFGREGAVLTDSEHPFAPYVSQLSPRIGYRLYANEEAVGLRENGRVFARSGGGVAIGFELPVGNGTIVVLPAVNKPDSDRKQISSAILECLERWDNASGRAGRIDTQTGVT
jgi:hypothetical protein